MNRFFRYHLDHVLFWVLTIGFHAYTQWFRIEGVGAFVQEIVVRNALLAVVIYFNLLIVFPRINRGRVLTGAILLICSLVFYAIVKHVHDVYLCEHPEAHVDFIHSAFYNFSIVIFYLAFATALHLSKQWYIQRELLQRIKVERLNSELEYLKAQMNPHFLFNSINTIFFQINKENTEARETLGKFSDMLRYQLYECNGNEIAIEKELAYLKNYVELQKLRRNADDTVEFTVSDTLKNFFLPPLLLIPFIENAFKHVSNFTDRKNEVKISLGKDDSMLSLRVTNTTDQQTSTEPGGIGLKNVTRRLELLYPNRHTLDVQQTPDRFDVHLTLELL